MKTHVELKLVTSFSGLVAYRHIFSSLTLSFTTWWELRRHEIGALNEITTTV